MRIKSNKFHYLFFLNCLFTLALHAQFNYKTKGITETDSTAKVKASKKAERFFLVGANFSKLLLLPSDDTYGATDWAEVFVHPAYGINFMCLREKSRIGFLQTITYSAFEWKYGQQRDSRYSNFIITSNSYWDGALTTGSCKNLDFTSHIMLCTKRKSVKLFFAPGIDFKLRLNAESSSYQKIVYQHTDSALGLIRDSIAMRLVDKKYPGVTAILLGFQTGTIIKLWSDFYLTVSISEFLTIKDGYVPIISKPLILSCHVGLSYRLPSKSKSPPN
ncbi:hypothetical protein BH11BAC7_BH11BAC7_23170 [soil metagenome]